MYNCKILADSINTEGHRLTTFEIRFPRFILAEVNTHRMFSRNSASSRAIPTEKTIQKVEQDPFVPEFNYRVTGMGVGDNLKPDDQRWAKSVWLGARNQCVKAAQILTNVDKSRVNRLLEPFAWHTAIVSATDWSNFFALRTHPDAQPEFRTIALMMREAYENNEPRLLSAAEWHLPLVSEDEILTEAHKYSDPIIEWELWKKVAIGRCARVSYLTHDGKRDLEADISLYERLKASGHLSPFEHVARPFSTREWQTIHAYQDSLKDEPGYGDGSGFIERLIRNLQYCGTYQGWHQVRFNIDGQENFQEVLDALH